MALPPPPLKNPIVELGKGVGIVTGAMTRDFAEWLRSLTTRADGAAVAVIQPVELESQGASIATTDLLQQANGLYQVTWRIRVRRAATTSSSIQLTITTTEDSITVTQSSAAFTGNVTNTPVSGSFLVRCDPAVPLAYSTTYASVGGTSMQYDLDLVLEAV
jgi:hypothetical protein